MFLDAYNSHIVNLNKIESVCKTSYHKMMAEIYQGVVSVPNYISLNLAEYS